MRLGRQFLRRGPVAGLAVAVALSVWFAVGRRTVVEERLVARLDRTAPRLGVGALDPGGARVTLGGRTTVPTVVNLWASWCIPCRKEMPVLAAEAARRGQTVRFVGIDNKDGRVDGRRFLARYDVRYPNGFDPEGVVAAKYGAMGLPTTFFVTRSGRLWRSKTGAVTAGQLTSLVDGLLERP